jgi:hypothetical protein
LSTIAIFSGFFWRRPLAAENSSDDLKSLSDAQLRQRSDQALEILITASLDARKF